MPDLLLKQRAHTIYLSTLDQYKYDTDYWISKNAVDNLLRIYGLWNDSKENEYKALNRAADLTKIELYLKFNDSRARENLRKKIREIENSLSEQYQKKHYFDHLTLEFYANSLKNQYIIMQSVFDMENNKIFGNNIDDIDTIFLEKILYEINNNTVGMDALKDLVKSELWKQYWSCLKENIFDKPAYELTDDQRSIINISKMYDSIREHHECPSDDIINDNDALDGWILHQRDKIEKEKKREEIENRTGIKNKRADEVFVFANSKEEVREIYDLNDAQTKQNIKQMKEIAKQKGSVEWSELPHVKQKIQENIRQGKK